MSPKLQVAAKGDLETLCGKCCKGLYHIPAETPLGESLSTKKSNQRKVISACPVIQCHWKLCQKKIQNRTYTSIGVASMNTLMEFSLCFK